jgi:hypothetical protein
MVMNITFIKNSVITFIIILTHYHFIWATNFPDIEGWAAISEVMSYNRDNLWEYINGEADQFLDYGFQELMVREFSRDTTSISVDIYNMENALNAFGIYTIERPENNETLKIGAEAVIAPPSQCLLLKDNYYIKIYAFEGHISDDMGKTVLQSLAKSLPGQDKFPDEINLLPSKGKIERSERFILKGYLGLTDLNNCLFADYRDDNGDKYQYFYISQHPLESVDSFIKNLGKKWREDQIDGRLVQIREVPYQGYTGIILVNDKIYGVSNLTKESEIIQKLRLFLE